MARVIFVKRAQQRYRTVPVLDEDGKQKVTPVIGKNGQQKLTKTGRPVFQRQTAEDKSQPLPNRTCEKCGNEIKVGDPYKHVTPFSGRKRVRCATCPTWQSWDLSNSLGARIEQVQHDNALDVNEDTEPDEILDALQSASDAIRELAEEKRDSASNIEDGFGHPTYQSDELNEQADALEGWADEMENASVPDKPDEVEEPGDEPEDSDSDEWREWRDAQDDFEQYENDLSDWVNEATDVMSLLDNSPI